ncbi:hypothetical protein QQX98_009785 [Neonectria punicea]|uniref:Quinate repressor protein n=1 Tax=Neonectria punicea TaxID=979145 RepID=A0ABR1GRR0_9HYPO
MANLEATESDLRESSREGTPDAARTKTPPLSTCLVGPLQEQGRFSHSDRSQSATACSRPASTSQRTALMQEDATAVSNQQTSRRQSPCYSSSSNRLSRKYDADASIALIGMRGTGMSTLAVMASSALGFKLVDADHQFYQTTTLSRGAYKSRYGVEKYRQEELRLMQSMLVENPSKAIIVCGPGVVEATGQTWLTEYAQSHPIIYIMRDAEDIEKHLRVWDAETISRLARLSGPTHRTLSNFEFYNLSDPSPAEAVDGHPSGQQSPRSLALKHLELDFIEFIYGISQRTEPHEAHHSLSLLPLESRLFTYALSLPISTPGRVIYRLGAEDMAADAVELVVSLSDMGNSLGSLDNSAVNFITRQFWMAKRTLRLPIIVHVQPPAVDSDQLHSRSQAARDESNYFELLHHALRLAPEYLSVDTRCDDQRIRDLIAAKGRTKVVGHFFDSAPLSHGWDHPKRKEKIRRAEDLGCDMVRLCQEATSVEDNFLAQKFIQDVKVSGEHSIPVIAYNTGRLGRTSCFLNMILSPVTHPLLRSIVPVGVPTSLVTIQEAQNALYSSFILDKVYFGIYGANVAQSFSPAMHNASFAFYKMPHEYRIFQHQSLSHLQQLINDPKFNGASITAPFKREVIPLVDKMSREAQAIGAVNTLLPLRSKDPSALLVRNRAGHAAALYGDNTDWIGIHVCIRRNLSPINAIRPRTTALILGAGGMARAAIYALIRLGVRTVFVHNRTLKNAVELAAQFQGWPLQEGRSKGGHAEQNSLGVVSTTSEPATNSLTVRVIPSKEDPWPADVDNPTIIVSCIVTQNVDGKCSVDTSLPNAWLASPTGGVVIEVCTLEMHLDSG